MKSKFIDGVRQVYEENREGLFTYAMSLAGKPEEAEDAVQAAFFSLLQRSRLPRQVRPYVYRCVRNAVIDAHRRKKTRRPSAEDPVNSEYAERNPVRDRALSQCLSRLSQSESEAIILKVFGGLGFREIASVSGEAVSTVSSRYRRGLQKMRTMLEECP